MAFDRAKNSKKALFFGSSSKKMLVLQCLFDYTFAQTLYRPANTGENREYAGRKQRRLGVNLTQL